MDRAAAIALLLLILSPSAFAQQIYRDDFEGPRTAWRPDRANVPYAVRSQTRTTQLAHTGRQSELVVIESGAGGSYVYFGYSIGRAQVIEELVSSVWVEANRSGIQLLAEVTLPRVPDQQTGGAMTTLLRGDISDRSGQWQKLEVKQPLLALERQQRILRAALRQQGRTADVDIREAYISRLILNVYTGPGRSEVAIDDLRVGPFVGEMPRAAAAPADLGGGPNQPGQRPANSRVSFPRPVWRQPRVRIEMRQERLFLNDIPALPRIIDAPAVPAGVLREAGFTTIALKWPPRAIAVEDAARSNFWFLASLPTPTARGGGSTPAAGVAAMRQYPHADQVLIWDLGTLPPGGPTEPVGALARAIRQADPAGSRPVAAEVLDNHRNYSRSLNMLGVERSELGTDHTLDNYRDWLYRQRRLAVAGKFFYTWLPLKPPRWYERALADPAAGPRSPPPPEPEQIRLLTYTALSAGYHAIGYRGNAALGRPEGRERLLAVQVLNLETQLLEPLIAAAKETEMVDPLIVPPVPVKPTPHRGPGPQGSRNRFGPLDQQNSQQSIAPAVVEASSVQPEVHSAMLLGDRCRVLLPVWCNPGAQFAPSQMAADNLKLVIRGVPETAQAWEVSLAEVHSIKRERVPGGTQVIIPEFDTTAIVVFTTDTALVRDLQAAVEQLRPKAGQLMWELAAAKYARVEPVFQRLTALRHAESDGAEVLRTARGYVLSSKRALDAGDPKLAIGEAQRGLRALRVLERTHWDAAVKDLNTPLATPYSLSYFTLPEFYQFMDRIRGVGFEPAGLVGGDFEDAAGLARAGWSQELARIDGLTITATLAAGQGHNGSRGLHLVAFQPSANPQPVIARTTVALTSPRLPVQAGAVVRISFWVRVPQPMPAGSDGGIVFDSIGGPGMALHFDTPCLWRRVELYRPVTAARSVAVTLGLSGVGEVYFDDVKIERLARRGALARGMAPAAVAR